MSGAFLKTITESYPLRHEPEAARRLGHVSWSLIVVCSLMGACAAAGYSAWLFVMPADSISSASTAPVVSSFNRAELSTIVKKLEERSAAFRARVK